MEGGLTRTGIDDLGPGFHVVAANQPGWMIVVLVGSERRSAIRVRNTPEAIASGRASVEAWQRG